MSLHHTTATERSDELLYALADGRRRAVVSSLRDATSDRTSVATLAAAIAPPDGSDPEDVAIRLHHETLPRLDEIGVLEFDPQSGSIVYRGDEDLEAVLDVVEAL